MENVRHERCDSCSQLDRKGLVLSRKLNRWMHPILLLLPLCGGPSHHEVIVRCHGCRRGAAVEECEPSYFHFHQRMF